MKAVLALQQKSSVFGSAVLTEFQRACFGAYVEREALVVVLVQQTAFQRRNPGGGFRAEACLGTEIQFDVELTCTVTSLDKDQRSTLMFFAV